MLKDLLPASPAGPMGMNDTPKAGHGESVARCDCFAHDCLRGMTKAGWAAASFQCPVTDRRERPAPGGAGAGLGPPVLRRVGAQRGVVLSGSSSGTPSA